jgi:hypothetical protein
LAVTFPDDIDSYVDGKTELILGILREAGFSSEQLEAIERMNRKRQLVEVPGPGPVQRDGLTGAAPVGAAEAPDDSGL